MMRAEPTPLLKMGETMRRLCTDDEGGATSGGEDGNAAVPMPVPDLGLRRNDSSNRQMQFMRDEGLGECKLTLERPGILTRIEKGVAPARGAS